MKGQGDVGARHYALRQLERRVLCQNRKLAATERNLHRASGQDGETLPRGSEETRFDRFTA